MTITTTATTENLNFAKPAVSDISIL